MLHPPDQVPRRPAADPQLTAFRMIDITFGCDEVTSGQARAAWLTGPGELWISDALDASDRGNRAIDPQSTSGIAGLATSPRARGVVVGLLGADGSLMAAVAPDDDAVLRWQRAALDAAAALEQNNPGRTLVDRLIRAGHLAVAGRVRSCTPPPQLPTTVSARCVRQLVVDHLALRLRAVAPALVGADGVLPSRLARLDRTPLDVCSHLPARTGPIPALPPDAADAAGMRRWLTAPVTSEPFAPSRLLAAVAAERVDVMEAFPDLANEQWRIGLWRWAREFGADPEHGAGMPPWSTRPPRPIPETLAPPEVVTHRDRAVRVVGYLEASLGLGEAARLAVRALEKAGEPVETLAYRHVVSPPTPFRHRTRPGCRPADLDLICLSGFALSRWSTTQLKTIGPQPYRIGLWFWETDTLPPEMIASLPLLDELWVTSEYTANAVHQSVPATVPVSVIPLGIGPAEDTNPAPSGSTSARRRAAAQCESLAPHVQRRWCGFSFDLASRLLRKNPLGLIAAWSRAFPIPHQAPGTPLLIIKTVNSGPQPMALADLQSAVENRPDIVLIDEDWSPTQHEMFVRALSVYASLHRSEGYGLVLLRAMTCGVPVLATGATGNLAFMDDSTAWLVPATPMLTDHADGPYPAGSSMAEPHLDVAAGLLGYLLDPANETTIAERARFAQQQVEPLVDGQAAAAWVARRLSAIRQQLSMQR